MHFSSIALTFFVTLATAAPAPTDGSSLLSSKRSPENIQLKDGNVLLISDSTAKRSTESVQLKDGSFLQITDSEEDVTSTTNGRQIKRDDGITSCGPKSGWTPVEDLHSPSTGTLWWGFNSAVAEFCQRASFDLNGNPIILQSKKKASLTVRHHIEDDRSSVRVALKGFVPGHIEFEINNKSDAEFWVDEASCKENLLKLSATGQDCYGNDNKDTKGGTFEVNKVSFHALPASG